MVILSRVHTLCARDGRENACLFFSHAMFKIDCICLFCAFPVLQCVRPQLVVRPVPHARLTKIGSEAWVRVNQVLLLPNRRVSQSPRRHARRHDDPRSTRVATCLRLPNLAVHRRKPLPVYSRQINLAVHRRKPLRVYLCLMNPADHRPGQAAVRKGTNTCSCLTKPAGHPPPNQAVRRNPQMW